MDASDVVLPDVVAMGISVVVDFLLYGTKKGVYPLVVVDPVTFDVDSVGSSVSLSL